jgi:hypothetical protein
VWVFSLLSSALDLLVVPRETPASSGEFSKLGKGFSLAGFMPPPLFVVWFPPGSVPVLLSNFSSCRHHSKPLSQSRFQLVHLPHLVHLPLHVLHVPHVQHKKVVLIQLPKVELNPKHHLRNQLQQHQNLNYPEEDHWLLEILTNQEECYKKTPHQV